MKRFLILIFLFMGTAFCAAAPPSDLSGGSRDGQPYILDSNSRIDINNIEMISTNYGRFAYDQGLVGPGLWFPRGTDKTLVYSAGLWIGGKIDGEVRVTVAAYGHEYIPGQIIGCEGGDLEYISGVESPDYRVYKINQGDDESSPDYAEWPFEQGAPYLDQNENGHYDLGEPPRLLGSQTLFSVYHDGDPSQHHLSPGNTPPLGVEIQHTVYGFNRNDALGNVVFLDYKIVNKGCHTIEDAYLGLWTDPDVGSSGSDLAGCDTTLDMGYCYNGENYDPVYGVRPPAVGLKVLQGPIVPSADPSDTVILPDGRIFYNAKMLKMTSFSSFPNEIDPHWALESYACLQGFGGDGWPIINPITGQITPYMFSGDPITGQGWIDTNSSDRRMIPSSGPFTLPPWQDIDEDGEAELGEPGVQQLITALIVAQGYDYLSSVSLLRYYAYSTGSMFEAGFDSLPPTPNTPISPEVTIYPGDVEITLIWNHAAETDYQDPNFQFEGYNVYQFSMSQQPAQIAVFDVVNGVTEITQPMIDPETGDIVEIPVQHGTDSGIQNSLHITEDFLEGEDLINGREYLYAVTAYYYNPDSTAEIRAIESPVEIIEVFPEGDYNGFFLPVIHENGRSNGIVEPLVIDPTQLTGDRYEITFTAQEGGTHALWNLQDLTTGEYLLTDQQQNMENYEFPVVHGVMVRVIGQSPGVLPGDVYTNPDQPELWGWDIPQGERRITWARGDFGREGFRGAIGWGCPNWVFGGGDPCVPANELKKTRLILARVPDTNDYDPNFDPQDPNVSYAYRYGRNFSNPPEEPEFAEHIIHAEPGYSFQNFERSVPISAWDIENPDEPRRLAVGFLENNQPRTYDPETGEVVFPGGGLVDGVWWPGNSDMFDNVASEGPREWLWIFDVDYSETPNPEFMVELVDNAVPVMYWITASRRGQVPFSPSMTGDDQFDIIPSRPNTEEDVFLFGETIDVENQRFTASDHVMLFQNYPNTFNPQTLIPYYLPNRMHAEMTVYNISGQKVKTLFSKEKVAGHHTVRWDGKNDSGIHVASGVYFYQLKTGEKDSKLTRKMILMK
ncbi:MAG: hypothetical protein B6244_03075 [Candidatus Cloacimonetes bacterium 4572_55]|nr:MAG: hypothetical protein B6244_03075 [Candidatus Cloacimonetes bacterium 4572_55]